MNTTTSTTDQTSDVVVACCNGHARCPGAGDGFRRRWRMEVDAGLTPIEALSALMAIGNYVSGLTLVDIQLSHFRNLLYAIAINVA